MLDISVTVTRRRTSRITIRIAKDGAVKVSAPRLVPRATIEKFVAEHREWIEKARQRAVRQQAGREAFYSRLDVSTPALRKEASERLDTLVTPMVAKHSEQMGVKPSGIGYRSSKSRWGSCNTRTRHITFSLYLLLLPNWCIEHIVVHEMAHLIEPNHSHRFYAIMDRHFPRWQEARKETRRLTS